MDVVKAKTDSPRVSVIMSVYNTERFVGRAIESILAQTFTDFEFLIVDDASTDRSREVIGRYKDPRIIRFDNECNIGDAESRNRTLRHARGEFIAVMDSDDVSHPERLSKQVRYMERHPEVGVCGTWCRIVREDGSLIGPWHCPEKHNTIVSEFFFGSIVPHPTALIRKAEWLATGQLYDPNEVAHDFDLWVRLIQKLRFANVQEELYTYYRWSGQISTARKAEQDQSAGRIFRYWFGQNNIDLTDEQLALHMKANQGPFPFTVDEAESYTDMLRKLYHFSLTADGLDRKHFRRKLIRMYRKIWRDVKPKIRLKIDKRLFAISLWWMRVRPSPHQRWNACVANRSASGSAERQ